MSACDCSNCQPEEAKALWKAQCALTSDNIDTALAMSAAELNQLFNSLPNPPPPPAVEQRPFAFACGKDDTIFQVPLLKTLVQRLEEGFKECFLSVFTECSDLGPPDYFGNDLAWDVAKNIDVITKPSDLAIVLVSETIPGQFESIFKALCQWKEEFQPDELMAKAVACRKKACISQGRLKIPQSVEAQALAAAQRQQAKDAQDKKKELAEMLKADQCPAIPKRNDKRAADDTLQTDHAKTRVTNQLWILLAASAFSTSNMTVR
ncbi:uncharacterized protein MELLADRAFT_112745 [Melampsora larici-populina 98AG31]|uniref:Uncharacterized protein n=1 Tax=Melampsora larici-populina (strain 98AG31 / pathotype 3-4-7) TaxID=747676 RepID=F4S7G2_MELLP|nr:uncharacterized protein MELLADRAFT_112745 [Melampsora larici-populina 98AG31]EGF99431.1 hypothetical protein MELLADRAFT_112745 [Melampsora larici-populina 98AG31]